MKSACAFFHKDYILVAKRETIPGGFRAREARGSTVLTEDPNGDEQRREMMRVSGQFMGHGLRLALAVLLFMGLGAWLDSKLGWPPILMVIGAFVGGGAGFYSLYSHIVIEPRERDKTPE